MGGIGIRTLVRERERKGYGWLAQRSVVVRVLRVKVDVNPSVLVVPTGILVLIRILGVKIRLGIRVRIRVRNRVLWVKVRLRVRVRNKVLWVKVRVGVSQEQGSVG